ncbi:MAG: nucleotidyl transferase AbiEii/AbiGii toxin family protein [Caldilineaceae bacterium]|nr:nucleotidyl transferase AbiEii/AbiGii toxin family protein [Caldilineaceae bacterium]
MQALTFWKTITVDNADLLQKFIAFLDEHAIRYCVIGGQAVNAYAEPVVSLDLDLVIAVEQLPQLSGLLAGHFVMKSFPHSLNISLPGSDLRIQIQTDPRYAGFPERAEVRSVLGIELPVASLTDVMQGKVWAVSDPGRRPSKRQKDLADIARLLENHPQLRSYVPQTVLDRLFL